MSTTETNRNDRLRKYDPWRDLPPVTSWAELDRWLDEQLKAAHAIMDDGETAQHVGIRQLDRATGRAAMATTVRRMIAPMVELEAGD